MHSIRPNLSNQQGQNNLRYNNDQWLLSNGTVTDVAIEYLCQVSPLQDQLVWLEPVSYTVFADYCHKIKG